MRLHHPQLFTKMHALGNDFVVMSALQTPIYLTEAAIKKLADRHTGIGFDQLFIIEHSKEADFFCRIFNADGSEAFQCGNGLRCIARFVHENGLITSATFSIATKAGVFPVSIKDYDHISIRIPVETAVATTVITLNDEPLTLYTVSLGNPHAILKIDNLAAFAEADFAQKGQAISTHTQFKDGVNVGFMQVLDRQHIALRTYERGAGLTQACGSNACAAALVSMANDWVDRKVAILFPRGKLQMARADRDDAIIMTGPAVSVFAGSVLQ